MNTAGKHEYKRLSLTPLSLHWENGFEQFHRYRFDSIEVLFNLLMSNQEV